MKIDTFYPEHPVLKDCIAYYYFQKTDVHHFTADYYAFPNTLQALNIHKNISCEINSHQVKVTGIEEHNHTLILQGKFERPLHVQLRGLLDKVTIIFKPLGLNHFITSPYIKIGCQPTQIFNDWGADNSYTTFLGCFYKETDNKKRIRILEEYLLLQYSSFNESKILKPALDMLSDFSVERSMDEIASRMQLNTRTFNRLFLKHLGIPPVGYRKIARFRHSLKNKLFDTHFATLTQIGYASNFYDQSYFNKIYKKITGENPSRFFNSVDSLADNQLIFKFVNK